MSSRGGSSRFFFLRCRVLRIVGGLSAFVVGASVLGLPQAARSEPVASPATRPPSVLVVYSYDPDLKWNRELAAGLSSAWGATPGLRVYSEYLDAKRWPELPHAESFVGMLGRKYRARPLDVLLIADDPAFELLEERRRELFPGVPTVFMGLNRVRQELLGGVPDVTGIFELHETTRTVDFALQLTGAEGVVIVNDTSETGRANQSTIDAIRERNPDLEVVVYEDLVAREIGTLARHPAHWPVLPMLAVREGHAAGAMLTQDESVRLLRERLPNPLFYDIDWIMGSGVVGGYSLSARDHAEQAGEIALAILAGARPEELPARVETRHRWLWDDRELERFGWSRRVPAGSEIWFREESYVERHRAVLAPMLVGLILALGVILVLVLTLAEQRRASRRLRQEEQRLATALSASHAGVFEIGASEQGYASHRWLEMVGLPPGKPSSVTDWLAACKPESRGEFFDALSRLRVGSQRERFELLVDRAEPRRLDILMTIGRRSDRSGPTIVGVARDVTATRQLEEANSRRERLNALGELAGGIAHDFNNILTVININTEVIRESSSIEDIRELSAEVSTAGERAADLVRQLLAFGRHDVDDSDELDLNEPVRNLHQFLHRLIGEQHELVTLLADEPVGVLLQPAQAEQVLANLVLNARDAMPDGGTIRVETRIVCEHGVDWSVLTVTDEGVGMDEATQARVFEPFFTTKPLGEGTGLGLSTVYGIVASTAGQIEIDSLPGRGTTFHVRWQRVAVSEALAEPTAALDTERADCSVLVVEDEPSISRLICRILDRAGYRVQLAIDGNEGLTAFEESRNGFDLVLTDVVLPRLSGIEMAAEIRKRSRSVPIGFMSGYTRHPAVAGRELPAGARLLGKPFSRTELLGYVSDCLEQRGGESDREAKQAAGFAGGLLDLSNSEVH